MQKLVLQYNIGDGHTWNSDITSPFLYSSKEDAIIDFMILVEKQKTVCNEFIFAGLELTAEPFGFLENNKMFCANVNIQTVEEWFEQNSPE
jgi:hypothetical protein